MTLRAEIDELIRELTPRTSSHFEENAKAQANGITMPHKMPRNTYLPLYLKEIDPARPDESIDLWPGHIRFPLEEQVLDKEKMLYEQLVALMPINRCQSDAILNIMPKFGNAFLLSGLGLDCVFIGDMLENARILTAEEADNLEVSEHLEDCFYIKKALEFIAYCKEVLPNFVHIGLCFMMSPYDLAYLVRGSELMLDMYEDPDAVHRLMEKCTDLYVRSIQLLKQAAGEPDDYFYYFEILYAGANIICEDCVVMLSPELHKEFVLPYTQKAMQALGPCWVHFCGNGAHLLDNYCAVSEILGISYGQLHLNTPLEETIAKHHTHGKALNCESAKLAPKQEHETFENYFRRLYAMSNHGEHILYMYTYYKGEVDSTYLMDLWHQIQDEDRNMCKQQYDY